MANQIIDNDNNSFEQLIQDVSKEFNLTLKDSKSILDFSFKKLVDICEQNGKFNIKSMRVPQGYLSFLIFRLGNDFVERNQ